jgi:hypothetical protein
MLPCFNRKPSKLGADARKQGTPTCAGRRTSVKRCSDNGNSGNSLAINIADVFDEVRASTQKRCRSAAAIEPCSHRPAEYADRNASLSILSFENCGLNVLRTYIATMICSIAHRSQRSVSHERTEICITPFTLLLDHFL